MDTLKATTDFQRVRREGRSWSHPLVILTTCPNERNETRLGITASKSVGSAVDRNRAKRRLREAVRRKEAVVALGQDIVLIARAPLVKAEWHEVVGALNSLMQKARLVADGK